MPLRAVFEAPTVSGLADAILSARNGGKAAAPNGIPATPRGQELRLSFAQQRIWLLDQLQLELGIYNMPSAVQIKGALDAARLEQALNEVVSRQEALRTTFASVDGLPIQIIAESLEVYVPMIDLSGAHAEQSKIIFDRLSAEESQRRFDLAGGPLIRAALVRLGSDEHILLVTIHHIVSDGWSMGVFVRGFSAIYEALTLGKPGSLPELKVQYADFAEWQRAWFETGAHDGQLEYWKRQLGGELPVLQLPTERPISASQSRRGARRSLTLSRELSERLDDVSRREGVTPFMSCCSRPSTRCCTAGPASRTLGANCHRGPRDHRDPAADRLFRKHPRHAKPAFGRDELQATAQTG